jgi:ABC-type phosphate/phosphonate transport system substrate-binding protein
MSISVRNRLDLRWLALFPVCLAAFAVPAPAQKAGKIDVLRIGATHFLTEGASEGSEETAYQAFRDFIKGETGYANDLDTVENYTELADKLASGRLHIGVFLGQEFAWAKAKNPKLVPLATSVNIYPYRYASLLINADSKAADFAALKGQTLSMPKMGVPYLRLFVDRHCRANDKKAEEFFAKVTIRANVEEALDALVDGSEQVVVVDRVGAEAYKRRKPGRYAQLKELMRSEPLLPALVAYHEGSVDAATLGKVREGLINAGKKKQGQRLLDLFRLTGFQTPPKDFDTVMAEALKANPAPTKEK